MCLAPADGVQNRELEFGRWNGAFAQRGMAQQLAISVRGFRRGIAAGQRTAAQRDRMTRELRTQVLGRIPYRIVHATFRYKVRPNPRADHPVSIDITDNDVPGMAWRTESKEFPLGQDAKDISNPCPPPGPVPLREDCQDKLDTDQNGNGDAESGHYSISVIRGDGWKDARDGRCQAT